MKTIWNLFVVLTLVVILLLTTHGFESWFIDVLLGEEFNFTWRHTFDLIRTIPAFIVGFVLGVVVALIVVGERKISWVILAALVLSFYSVIVRKTIWVTEVSVFTSAVAGMFHFFYVFGALAGVVTVAAIKSKYESSF